MINSFEFVSHLSLTRSYRWIDCEDRSNEQGREAIEEFLRKKWEKESQYRLKKRLFAFEGNRIAVQFWYVRLLPTIYSLNLTLIGGRSCA